MISTKILRLHEAKCDECHGDGCSLCDECGTAEMESIITVSGWCWNAEPITPYSPGDPAGGEIVEATGEDGRPVELDECEYREAVLAIQEAAAESHIG